jgi:hypothetical protein
LREFSDLHDLNRQVRQWVSEVANRRLHNETRERPLDRFKPEALRPLPIMPTAVLRSVNFWTGVKPGMLFQTSTNRLVGQSAVSLCSSADSISFSS